MPLSAKFFTVNESKRASLERAFIHSAYASNGINSHTARHKSTTHENIRTSPPLHYRHNIQNNSVRRRK
jgi:hypothetical protein